LSPKSQVQATIFPVDISLNCTVGYKTLKVSVRLVNSALGACLIVAKACPETEPYPSTS
jgi:hypothetical protein